MKATVLTLAALAIGTSAQDPDLPGCELDAAAMGVNAADINSLPQCGVSIPLPQPLPFLPCRPGTEIPCACLPERSENSRLPQQTCVNNMINIGPSIGCPAVDNGQPAAACLCSKEDFAYGIRDCSSESCPAGTDLQQVNQYGLDYCQSGELSLPLLPLPSVSPAQTSG